MNNILTLETNKYAIKLDNFEGPLDLLCHLVDKNKMDINQIKISEIIIYKIKKPFTKTSRRRGRAYRRRTNT